MHINVISAHTSHPNTPESDLLPKVDHDVSIVVDGTPQTVRHCSQDPLTAMDEIIAMTEAELAALPRVAREHT